MLAAALVSKNMKQSDASVKLLEFYVNSKYHNGRTFNNKWAVKYKYNISIFISIFCFILSNILKKK